MFIDPRCNERPDDEPPSRASVYAVIRARIGQALQARYQPPQKLPREMIELVARLQSKH
jgi:hypothetical protein